MVVGEGRGKAAFKTFRILEHVEEGKNESYSDNFV